MSPIARKGTRLIEVDGRRYRWTVAPDDEPGLGIVIEDAERPAQRTVVWVEHGTVVSPGVVRQAIALAKDTGWVPEQAGPPLVLRYRKQTSGHR